MERATAPDQGYYDSAVVAITARDYATALDDLQAASASEPHSARILNAFAVVYDKLGRFDLSARYYAEASAVDPASPVIARNIAYSRALQRMMAQGISVEPAASGIIAAREVQPSPSDQPASRLNLRTHHRISIAYARTRRNAHALFRHALAHRRWKLARAHLFKTRLRAKSASRHNHYRGT